MIRLLMEIYIHQVNHIAHRLSIDNEIREILVSNGQEKPYLFNDSYTNSTFLGQKVVEYGGTLDNATNIKNIKIMNEKGEILLSSHPGESGKNISSSKPYPDDTNRFLNTLTNNSVPLVHRRKSRMKKDNR